MLLSESYSPKKSLFWYCRWECHSTKFYFKSLSCEGVAVAGWGCGYLPGLDGLGAVYPEGAALRYLRGHVHRRPQDLHEILPRLLPLHCRLRSRLLHAASESGELLVGAVVTF